MSKYYLRWLTPIFLFLLGALSSNSGVSWGHFISPLAAKSFSLSVPWESMCLLRALCGYILPFSVWCGHFYVALPCPTWTSIPIQSLHRCPYVFQECPLWTISCASPVSNGPVCSFCLMCLLIYTHPCPMQIFHWALLVLPVDLYTPSVMQTLSNLKAEDPAGLQSSKGPLGAYVCRENVMNV